MLLMELLFIYIFFPPPDKYIHMLGVKPWSGAVWIHDLVAGDSHFDEVRLRLYSLQPFQFSGLTFIRHLILSRECGYWGCWVKISQEGWFDSPLHQTIHLSSRTVQPINAGRRDYLSIYASTGMPHLREILSDRLIYIYAASNLSLFTGCNLRNDQISSLLNFVGVNYYSHF